MNNKIKISCLILIVGALFSFLSRPDAKQNANDVSATLPAGCEKRTGNTNGTMIPGGRNLILQSKDGGQTWQDISHGLPDGGQPEDFFASESEIYLRLNDQMYRSRSSLNMPVWEKEISLDPKCTSIAFNRSGVIAYNHEAQFYYKMPAIGSWSSLYTSFKRPVVNNIFETSDGTVFLGCDNGLFKSTDNGKSWRQVVGEGWVTELVESDGVLVGTGQNGIMRSTDNGEHWESVISEGGVGITIERIDGGFAAIAYSSLTKSRRIYLSFDTGKTWAAIDAELRPALTISSIKQIGQYLVCGHPDGIFRSSDMGKTWKLVYTNIADKFNEGRVFKIYVSGDVLYAVMKNAGC
ncbi:MAG TPA: sialidase family protein [Chryseosolibacter sp.]|nr:sialidase family protein [Chryseosolibacter sp.]